MPFCAICLESGTLQYFKFFVECGHGFHERCVWGLRGPPTRCPSCRKTVNRETAIRIHIQYDAEENNREAQEMEASAIRSGTDQAVRAIDRVREARQEAARRLATLEVRRYEMSAEEEEVGAVGGMTEVDGGRPSPVEEDMSEVEKKLKEAMRIIEGVTGVAYDVLGITRSLIDLYTDQCLSVASFLGGGVTCHP